MSRGRMASWPAMAPVPITRTRACRATAAALALAVSVGWLVSAPAHSAHAAPATYQRACPPAPRGFASCDAVVRMSSTTARTAAPDVTVSGYGPADLQSAYRWPSSRAGVGRVVAVIDAYDLPAAENDLGKYRTQFGLPPCTVANGCFVKMNQAGDPIPANLPPPPPAGREGWNVESALDIEMVSASCPNCAIALVEANSDSLGNLAKAARAGAGFAQAVTNSYGGMETNSETSLLDPFYSVPGVVYTASVGDSGYGTGFPAGPQYPAATPDVVAVGGTTLTRDGSARGWSETAWSDTNSGCSAFEPKPPWQSDTGCAKRTEADVSAVADPQTGVATYGPLGTNGANAWGVVGGTSASSPLIAGAYMLAGGSPVQKASRLPYDRHAAHLNDVTSGDNASPCNAGYLCSAGAGYDGPTGLGTPAGVADFRSNAGVADFDAIGNTEFSVYRPSSHTWYVHGSTTYPDVWGTTGDIPVPADYLGDSFSDAAVYRPSTHKWYIQFGPIVTWGVNGDIPVPGDYNGDGPADIAVYRPSNHTWYEHSVGSLAWGANGDIPVPGDYNGDGITDEAVFRPSNHTWYVFHGPKLSYGNAGDVPVPGDYNGDGRTDIAVFRPSTNQWWINGNAPITWGTTHDAPEPGDYNGDGRTDVATWRPSNGTWYVRALYKQQWGATGDVPLVLPYAINRTR